MIYDECMMNIALTFDDGPNTAATIALLDVLESFKIPASFFLVGKHINPLTAKVIEREVKLGCTIECHSLTHAAFPELSAQQMIDEVEKTNSLITKYAGTKPMFFRPPYIALNPLMFETIRMPFIAGLDVRDWEESVSVEERVQGVVNHACNGRIVLLHDQEKNYATVKAVERIIPQLLDKGTVFCTVRDLFKNCGVDPLYNHDKGQIWTNVCDATER